ncbi:MAG: TetR/AcrR family transcriptional regulator [Planctomycetes bacterium]|nr:TetR/AcrR family transcriptional regulator [Planctomycetota bacterium]
MEQTKPIFTQEGHKEDVKNRLLDAAEALFCEKGFDRVSVRELTAAAGCNVAAVNYYFGGKDKLYAEMFRRQFGTMIQRNLDVIERVMSQPGVALEDLLRAVMKPLIRRVIENETGGKVIRLLVREILNRQIDRELFARDMKGQLFARLGRVILQLVPDIDPDRILLVVLSFDGAILHPFLFMEFYQEIMPDLTIDDLLDHMVRFVAAGIRGYAKPNQEGN